KDPGVYALQAHAFFREEHPAGLSHDNGQDLPWRSPIFMPRALSRITLEVVSVRVEHLQDINEDDCWHEGVSIAGRVGNTGGYLAAFSEGWDAINAKRGFPWKSNPYVWAVEFKRQS